MKTIPILYENDEIFIINKPSGIPVQGGVGITHSLDRELPEQTGSSIYLVHRLDQDTAGLMVVAKNPAAAARWTKLIAGHDVRKEYDAVCIGKFTQKAGKITETIEQHGEKRDAVTLFQVKREAFVPCDGSLMLPVSLVRLTLETGRMHQIRIHLAKQGCPVAGDDQHGNFKQNKLLRKAAGVKRLMLAAVTLTIPLNGGLEIFSVPLPEHMQSFYDLYFMSAC
ncbi:MAG: RluA family pseudouridine synthase [Treponema sp.]|nr:RluA family pseudouridine synthase [Treponema sp.]